MALALALGWAYEHDWISLLFFGGLHFQDDDEMFTTCILDWMG